MKRLLCYAAMLLAGACLSGCETVESALQVAGDVCGILDPPAPRPEPCAANAGVVVDGHVCVRMTDGKWRWVSVSEGR